MQVCLQNLVLASLLSCQRLSFLCYFSSISVLFLFQFCFSELIFSGWNLFSVTEVSKFRFLRTPGIKTLFSAITGHGSEISNFKSGRP